MPKHKYTVTFYSAGTLISETTTRKIGEWSISAAVRMAESIKERHGATPYGFVFETCITADPIPDGQGGTLNVEPKSIKRSGTTSSQAPCAPTTRS